MELELYGADDKFYSKLDQEDALLGSYPVDDGCRIHVRPPSWDPTERSFVCLFIEQILAVLCPGVITSIGPALMEPPVKHGEKQCSVDSDRPELSGQG